MSSLLGCDFECQREKNINKLREMYNKDLDNYYQTYNKFLQYKYSKDRNRHWKRTYANGTLKPKVEAINRRLNKILEELKKNIKSTEGIIKEQDRAVQSKTDFIHRKNKNIELQDHEINRNDLELKSKKRQIDYNMSRISYRRMMLILLVVINIVLGGAFFYLSKK